MIRWNCVINAVGKILLIAGVAMFLPLLWSILSRDGMIYAFVIPIVAYLILGGLLVSSTIDHKSIRAKESFLIVTLSWISVSVIGAFSYLLSGCWDNYLTGFFETMSGFTTTGATVIAEPGELPQSILVWRAMTQWLGGLGVVVLFVALLSQVDTGGLAMLRAELSGPFNEKISSKVQDSARLMWHIYVVLTVLLIVSLKLSGLSFCDAVCYGFSTVSTGGFSTTSQGLAAFESVIPQLLIIVFMFIGGISFPLLYRIWAERSLKPALKNEEFRAYGLVIVVISLFIFANLITTNGGGIGRTLLDSVFQTISQLTTTGFATVDYNLWPAGSYMLMVCLMMMGASYSSTSGSLKTGTYLLGAKALKQQVFRMLHPNAVTDIRINDKIIADKTVTKVLMMAMLFFIITFIGAIAVAFITNLPFTEALTSSMASISNNGAAMGALGPAGNYAGVPAAGLLILNFLMLLGRLEIYTVLIIFIPSFWKK